MPRTTRIEKSLSHEGCWYWAILDNQGGIICEGAGDQTKEDACRQAALAEAELHLECD